MLTAGHMKTRYWEAPANVNNVDTTSITSISISITLYFTLQVNPKSGLTVWQDSTSMTSRHCQQ